MGQIDQQRERIQDDLRGLVAGDVRCDDVFLELYCADASVYEIKPLGVVRPRSTDDVVACVQYAASKQIPIHARGAGSGTAGGAIGPGLILDFSKYLSHIKYTGAETVRVQPGVVCERLNDHLRPLGLVFGPNPANTIVTTIGSVIAVDGAGSHWLKYGSARNHIVSLRIVLADGSSFEAGREPLEEGQSKDPDPRKRDLINALVPILAKYDEVIRRNQPSSPVNRCGYRLIDVLGERHLDLARLLAGSEGTLALITEAVLATQPLPRYRAVVLFLFESLEKASRAVLEILREKPSACDLMDRRHLSLAREADPRIEALVPQDAEAMLLVELDGMHQADVRDRIHRLIDEIERGRQWAYASQSAFEPSEIDLLWRLARRVNPAAFRTKGNLHPVPIVDDVAVEPSLFPDFFVRMQNVLKRHQVTASVSCHAGQGQFHILPFLNLADRNDVQRMQRLAEDLYFEVCELGGTIGAEHASGLSRSPFLHRQYGELYDVFLQIKKVFDPQNLLNPGKVVGDNTALVNRNLRLPIVLDGEDAVDADDSEPGLRNLLELQFNWNRQQVAELVQPCNGCGDCRTQSPNVRMCPMFRIMPSEEASPRAKANLLRGVLTGQLDLVNLRSDEFKEIADLCINCHMCATECPAQVDIPRLMAEAKAAFVAANGLSFSDRILIGLDSFIGLVGRFSPMINWALGNRQMRWLMEKTLGIAHARKLPLITSRSFVRRAARHRLTRPTRRSGHKVAYFVDVYANHFDPQLGKALLTVMEHNGVAVYVPPDQRQSGMAAISCGAFDHARNIARRNVEIFAEAVRQGYHIVATEPSAALCLAREYPYLVDSEDARLVAQNSSEACSYLWKMHMAGKLQLDLQPINATLGYHTPCRLKSLGVGVPGEWLLRLIPGLTIAHIEEGCSGMAGAYGLKREQYRNSLRIGWHLIRRLRDPNLLAGTTECSTCKIQMEQGTNKPTIHPLKLLALAYGLMPEIAKLLTSSGKELTIT
jgi:FAD/FMN-containing dehydrogenase/Fe-S oxidoreductase